MTLNSFNDIKTNITVKKSRHKTMYKSNITADGTAVPTIYWLQAGNPAAGASPGSVGGVAPTKTTTGALNFQSPDGANKLFLLKTGFYGQVRGTHILGDILVFSSGLNGTVTTSQTVNSTALTRYTTGEGVLLGVICWTPTGTTASNITISYTNQAGTSGRTTVSTAFWTGGWGGGTLAPSAGQVQFLPLQSGDYGVRSVQSVTLSASTLTVGDFGIILFKPIQLMSITGSGIEDNDNLITSTDLTEIPDNTCFTIIGIPTSTTTGTMIGELKIVEG